MWKDLGSPQKTEFKARNDFQMPQALENEGFREKLVKKAGDDEAKCLREPPEKYPWNKDSKT